VASSIIVIQDDFFATSFEPVVDRSIHLNPFPEAVASRPSAAVRVTFTTTFPKPFLEEPSPQCLNADHKSFVGEFFASEGRSEVAIAFLVGA
jgi:hypothetical protein